MVEGSSSTELEAVDGSDEIETDPRMPWVDAGSRWKMVEEWTVDEAESHEVDSNPHQLVVAPLHGVDVLPEFNEWELDESAFDDHMDADPRPTASVPVRPTARVPRHDRRAGQGRDRRPGREVVGRWFGSGLQETSIRPLRTPGRKPRVALRISRRRSRRREPGFPPRGVPPSREAATRARQSHEYRDTDVAREVRAEEPTRSGTVEQKGHPRMSISAWPPICPTGPSRSRSRAARDGSRAEAACAVHRGVFAALLFLLPFGLLLGARQLERVQRERAAPESMPLETSVVVGADAADRLPLLEPGRVTAPHSLIAK